MCVTRISNKRGYQFRQYQFRQVLLYTAVPHVPKKTLNRKQRKAFDIIQRHHMNPSSLKKPLRIISGTAGTGKSWLVIALSSLLGSEIIRTSCTGMAYANIAGSTIHSAFDIPADKSKGIPNVRRLAELQAAFKNVHCVLIDEFSLLSQRLLAVIDHRCREATGQKSRPFGGLNVILVGDINQLPPVGGNALYNNCKDGVNLHGKLLYSLFTRVIIIDKLERQTSIDGDEEQSALLYPRKIWPVYCCRLAVAL